MAHHSQDGTIYFYPRPVSLVDEVILRTNFAFVSCGKRGKTLLASLDLTVVLLERYQEWRCHTRFRKTLLATSYLVVVLLERYQEWRCHTRNRKTLFSTPVLVVVTVNGSLAPSTAFNVCILGLCCHSRIPYREVLCNSCLQIRKLTPLY